MNIKFALIVAVCAAFPLSSVNAAEPTSSRPVTGFGSGTGMGPGGSAGSVSSVSGSFGSTSGASGAGSQTFGGGFNQQQFPGAGPLSANPASSAGGSAGAGAGGAGALGQK